MLKQETFGRMTNQNGASTLTWTEQYKHGFNDRKMWISLTEMGRRAERLVAEIMGLTCFNLPMWGNYCNILKVGLDQEKS